MYVNARQCTAKAMGSMSKAKRQIERCAAPASTIHGIVVSSPDMKRSVSRSGELSFSKLTPASRNSQRGRQGGNLRVRDFRQAMPATAPPALQVFQKSARHPPSTTTPLRWKPVGEQHRAPEGRPRPSQWRETTDHDHALVPDNQRRHRMYQEFCTVTCG